MGTYHGGKVKIGKRVASAIVSIMEKSKKKYKGYCEPFCGFCGVYRHIPDMFDETLGYTYENGFNYLAGDANVSVIKMWKGLQGNWKPPTACNKGRFEELKHNGREGAEKGFVGHACSFMGLYFTSFDNRIKIGRVSKIFKEMGKDQLADVEFTPGSYTQFSHLKGYVIYCDPPYGKNSHFFDKKNKVRLFDKTYFIDWCKTMKRKGNLVIVSEHSGGLLPFREIGIDGKDSVYVV
jgi:site-specific DNA-adenine methylase